MTPASPTTPAVGGGSGLLATLGRRSLPRVRLFCLPFAGAGPQSFHPWVEELPESVELVTVYLPGRGRRFHEAPFTMVPRLVHNLCDELALWLQDDKPFALFGHSLGAILAFETCRELRRRGSLLPGHLLVSGHGAPQRAAIGRRLSGLSDDEVVGTLRGFQGTPPEVLANRELMRLILPALRADLELHESYRYLPDAPLQCPITVFAGEDDRLCNRESLEAWQEQTTEAIQVLMFPGGHFFLTTCQERFLTALVSELAGLEQQTRG